MAQMVLLGREVMERELNGLVRTSVAALAAIAFCYSLPSLIRPGKWRLLAVLPVIALFALLPFSFSTVHLRGISAFFLCWLGTFKLLLFAFDRGPLCESGDQKQLPLPAFVAIALLPIIVKQSPSPPRAPKIGLLFSTLVFAIKGFLLSYIISLYPQRARFHRGIVLTLYCVHLYLALDLLFVGAAAAGRVLLPAGAVLEPQFSAPYLSSSYHEFWGRGWNLVVARILRSAVFEPIGAVWGSQAGRFSAFLVSGVMHEVMFFYLTLQPPTGEVTSFFVLHGIVTAAETAAKRWWTRRGMKPVHRALAVPLTTGFVVATAVWLFLPQILRSNAEEQILYEAEALLSLLRWDATIAGDSD